jgi:hypothetical protein
MSSRRKKPATGLQETFDAIQGMLEAEKKDSIMAA